MTYRSIGRRVVAAIAVLLVAVGAMGAWNLSLMFRSNAVGKEIDHHQATLEEAMAARFALARQENSMRGFMITRDPYFSDRVGVHLATFEGALDTIESMLQDPDPQARIGAIRDGVATWHQEIVQPVLRLAVGESTFAEARSLMLSGRADDLIAPIEDALDLIGDDQVAAIAEHRAEEETIDRRFLQVLVLGFAGTIGLAIVVGWGLIRSIAAPIRAMTDSMHALSQGDFDVTVPGAERADEIGRMAAAVEVFRAASRERVRLQSEVEAQGREAEARAERVQRDSEAAARVFSEALTRFKSGDLTAEIATEVPASYEPIKRDLNAGLAQVREALDAAKAGTSGIRLMSGEIASAAEDLSRRTESQAASLEETAAAVEEITATVKAAAESAARARVVVSDARQDAGQAGQVVREAVGAMTAIKASSQEIEQIIGVIDEIAFQTNLLALNAGVEAARAGEAGRGFAVVATEVRALAQRSAEAARQIKDLIGTSATNVTQGVGLVGRTVEALARIVEGVTRVSELVDGIAASASEQSDGLTQVNVAVAQMDRITQQNAAMVEESTAAARDLAHQIEQVASQIERFRTISDEGGRGPRSRATPRSAAYAA
ncbi:methyl-accepting chemotaxis protein [Rubellimicrobium aerolatum]|uniref:Methyl-accepting chemotaxis protein n=1 Tax=Rubellimicrobium aerolatum TaxID=490979 RepID=A0ABW0SFB9_9RHOB|nr:methyl-accepting chemotaxis protein [Rubellimicrobium aerolatum]MBP1807063.1 methyl-accepting chemotaxis protein [Rubellimicrobium aerolatum]